MARMSDRARRSLVAIIGLVGFLVLVEVVGSVLRVVVWRTRWRPGIDAIRRFNRTIRPVTAMASGKRTTTVRHTGRRSGREYATPVWAEQTGEAFFIQLPYGTDVDWCRNVLAGGGCVLRYDGVDYETVAPAIVPAAEALPSLPPGIRRMQRLARVESYLTLDINRAEGAAALPS